MGWGRYSKLLGANLEKSADAFRTIGEVAKELDVPKHVLRFWEAKFPQVKPIKRGGGRRLYRPEDIALLRGIRQLRYDALYMIIGVQQILRRDGVEFVKNYGRENDLTEEELESAEIRGSREGSGTGSLRK